MRIWKAHSEPIWSLVFSTDGAMLASGAEDHSVHLWNALSGELLHSFRAPGGRYPSIAFHPAGRIAAVVAGQRIQFRSLGSGRSRRRLEYTREENVQMLAFRPDGNAFALGGGGYVQELSVTGKVLHDWELGGSNTVYLIYSRDGHYTLRGYI